jgi:hypothetical protein
MLFFSFTFNLSRIFIRKLRRRIGTIFHTTFRVQQRFFIPSTPFLAWNIAMGSISSSQQSTDCLKDAVASIENNIEIIPQGGALHDSEDGVLAPKDGSLLPRADKGRHAWLFLTGCFVFEALVWDMFPCMDRRPKSLMSPQASRSLLVYSRLITLQPPPFAQHPKGIAAIGTCASGGM